MMLPSNQGDIKNVAPEPGRHQICNPLDFPDPRCESVTCNGCNMAMRDLPDMYGLMPYGQGVECLHSPTIFRLHFVYETL